MKQIKGIVAAFTLAVAVFFIALAGGGLRKLLTGAAALAPDASLADADGQYISYEVRHPVASFPAAYYSGDPNRVKRRAYVTYDEERQAFLKIVVGEQNKNGYERLMRAANMSDDVKDSWGDPMDSALDPVLTAGSLMPITDPSDIQEILDAMEEPDSKSTAALNALASSQADWYVIEEGFIQGLPTFHFWICAAAILLNLVFFLIALISLFAKGKGSASDGSPDGNAAALFKNQKRWLDSWCRKGLAQRTRLSIAAIVGASAALFALGMYVNGSLMETLTCHLPLGLIFGELFGIITLLSMGLSYSSDGILQRYWGQLATGFPSPRERDAIAGDLLEAEEEWSVLEIGKDQARHTIAGSRYWAVLEGSGSLTVVDSQLVGRITSEERSGQIRVGKVRTYYNFYAVLFSFRDSQNPRPDVQFIFHNEEAVGRFLTLLRRRLGGQAASIMQSNF